MIHFFSILISALFTFSITAKADVGGDVHLKNIDSFLDATVRCDRILLGIGVGSSNMLGTELAVWWTKQSIKKAHISPFVTQLKAMTKAGTHIEDIELAVKDFRLELEKNMNFQRCPQTAVLFFDAMENYVDFLLQ